MAGIQRPSKYASWCTDNDSKRVAAPSKELQRLGWSPGEAPPFQVMNWYFWLTGEWIKYLDQAWNEDVTNLNLDQTMRLLGGGEWSFDTVNDTVSWSQSFTIAIPGIPDAYNTVPAGSATLLNGQVLYLVANVPFTTTGVIAQGDTIVTELTFETGIQVGQTVIGDGIPAGTTVVATAPGQVTLSTAATKTTRGVGLTFTGVTPGTIKTATSETLNPAPNVVIIGRRSSSQVLIGANSGYVVLRTGERRTLSSPQYISTVTGIAGAALRRGQAVYLSTGATAPDRVGRYYLVDPTVSSRRQFAGFIAADVATDATDALIVTDGQVSFFTGLTPGAIYYVDPANPGAVTATQPSAPGQSIVTVGMAISPTTLKINSAISAPTAVPTLQSANTVLAGPATGASSTPSYRTLTNADLPASIAGNQPANTVLAGPLSGADSLPSYRALTLADLPKNISGGGGSKNYLSTYNGNPGNGNFEFGNTNGFSTFTTTVSTASGYPMPTGGITAGAASIATFAVQTTAPLAQTTSLNVVSATTGLAVGQGFISDAFTVDPVDRGSLLAFKIAYKNIAGAAKFNGDATNTLGVYIYDVDNATWIQPDGVYSFNQSLIIGQAQGSFLAAMNGTRYRIAVICINATTSATQFYFDELTVGPQMTVTVPIVSDWTSFTPTSTWSNANNNPLITGRMRRVGDSLEAIVRLNTFGTGAIYTPGQLQVSMPAGLVVDSNKLVDPTWTGFVAVGQAHAGGNNAGDWRGVVVIPAQQNYVLVITETVPGGWSATNPFTWTGNGNYCTLHFMVPIKGWSSGIPAASTGSEGRLIAASAYGAAPNGLSPSSTVPVSYLSFPTPDYDKTGSIVNPNAMAVATSLTGWHYRCLVNTVYDVTVSVLTGSITLAANQNITLYLIKNGVAVRGLGTVYGNGQNASWRITGSTSIQGNADDKLEIGLVHNYPGNIYLQNSPETSVSISARMPGILLAVNNVPTYCSATNSNGMVVVNGSIIVWNGIGTDSHGIISADRTTLTIPSPGRYQLEVANHLNGTSGGWHYLIVNGAAGERIGQSDRSLVKSSFTFTNAKAGDKIKIVLYSNDPSGSSTLLPNWTLNYMSLVKLD